MFAEEKPHLQALPLEPFRFYQYGERTVHLDGCVEVEAAYYGAPPAGSGVRSMCSGTRCTCDCSIRAPASCCASTWSEAWRTPYPRCRPPRRTPQHTHQLLARAHKASATSEPFATPSTIAKKRSESAASWACSHWPRVRLLSLRPGMRTRWSSAWPSTASCGAIWSAARNPSEPAANDPLIRDLTQYRDFIQQRIQFEESNQ